MPTYFHCYRYFHANWPPISLPITLRISTPISFPVSLPISLPVTFPISLPVSRPISLPFPLPISLTIFFTISLSISLPIVSVQTRRHGCWMPLLALMHASLTSAISWSSGVVMLVFLASSPCRSMSGLSASLRSFYFWSSADVLAKAASNAVPTQAKLVLGRETLSVEDLLSLPRLGRGEKNAGCYLSLSTKPAEATSSSSTSSSATNTPSRYTTTMLQQQCVEVGLYGGSTTNKTRGLSGRASAHAKEIRYKRIGIETSKHYAFAGRDGVQTDFFILAPDVADGRC